MPTSKSVARISRGDVTQRRFSTHGHRGRDIERGSRDFYISMVCMLGEDRREEGSIRSRTEILGIVSSLSLSLTHTLSLSLTHTHTHAHTCKHIHSLNIGLKSGSNGRSGDTVKYHSCRLERNCKNTFFHILMAF